MKLFLLTSLFATVLLVPASQAEWLVNYEQARALAKKENKPLLMDFTGSDWCPPCMIMEKRVYSSAAFLEYAKKNLILLKVDFPIRKPIMPVIQAQNNELALQYDTQSRLPTVVVLDSAGNELGRESGIIGRAEPGGMIAWINSLLRS